MWAVISDTNGNVALVGDNAPISVREITSKAISLLGMVEPIIVTHHETLESADNHANAIMR